MPRPPRPEEAGAYFHVTNRAKGFDPLFVNEADLCLFLAELRETVARTGWRCLTYCLMTTHYHLLIQTPEPNLGKGMWHLNGRYAKAFNRRHGGRGHVFGQRFRSEPLRRESHLLEAIRYVALNPVRARLVPDPGAWRWSSHRALVDPHPAPSWLARDDTLALFGGGGGHARRRYERFVEEGLPTARTTARSRRA